MKQQSVIFTCKICNDKFPLEFKKPSLMTPIYLERSCMGCDADYEFWIKVKRGSNGQAVDIESKTNKVAQKPSPQPEVVK
jgi:hypothetical protein